MASSLDVDFTVVSGRCSEAAPIQSDVTEDLRLIARFDDIKSAGGPRLARFGLRRRIVQHRHIQFSIGEKRRCVALLDSEFEAPLQLELFDAVLGQLRFFFGPTAALRIAAERGPIGGAGLKRK